jgi:hypothetical protein
MTLPHYCTNWPVGYLPLPCPQCARTRLEYGTNAVGEVVYVECEKCGGNSEDDTLKCTCGYVDQNTNLRL